MKNLYWILILISFQSYSQNDNWHSYKLDSSVKFQLPVENANLFDSVQNGIKTYELSAEKNEIVFSGNKMKIENSSLPNTLKDLKNLYDQAIPNISKSFPNTIEKKQDIERNGFKGQKFYLTDSIGNKLYESEVYLLDDNLFLFQIISKDDSAIKDSDYFFNQISLPINSGIEQLTGKSEFLKVITLFKFELLILIGIIGLIIGAVIVKNYLQHRLSANSGYSNRK